MSRRPAIAVLAIFLLCASQHSLSAAISESIESVLPRVVKIYGAGGRQKLEAYGTGFLVSAEGHIATVWSHVLDSDRVTVVLNDGRRFQARVVGFEAELDLAVLKLEGEQLALPYFDLADAAKIPPGTRVLGFSNMFKVATGDEAVSVQHGVVAAYTKLAARRGVFEAPYADEVYIVDAPMNNEGAAGGVITTFDGRLVGMIGKELRNAESNTWVSYAVPLTALRNRIQEIVSGQVSPSKTPEAEDQIAAKRYSALDFGIVLVPDVVVRTPPFIDTLASNSAALAAGLKPDDLILFVNDELVHSARAFKEQMGKLEAGDTLRLVVRRGDQLITVELAVPVKGQAR